MTISISRRKLLAWISVAGAWPMAARAQQVSPVIGFLHQGAPDAYGVPMAAFRQALAEAGFVEGQTITVEYRWANGQNGLLAGLAADLLRKQVRLMVATAGTAAQVVKSQTSSIPIVFGVGGDPEVMGLVGSLNRPAGNATGVNFFANALTAKRIGILHDSLPNAKRVAALVNPDSAVPGLTAIDEAISATTSVGLSTEIFRARNSNEIDAMFKTVSEGHFDALLVLASPLFSTRRAQLATLAAHYSIPAIFFSREFAEAGGLMSYGTSFADAYRQMGLYTARILKGEKPAELPVVQASKFEFVINLQTAKLLGLDIPPGVLAQADEVIE